MKPKPLAALSRFRPRRPAIILMLLPALFGCSMASFPTLPALPTSARSNPDDAAPLAYASPAPRSSSQVNGLIEKYAHVYGVPASLVRRVVQRESGGNPAARNGPYLGLMQIRHDAARSMGYSGSANGLLNPDTNLKYAVKYLRGAYLVAGRNADAAIRHYSRGYYYEAKRLGLLEETGLR